MSYVVQPIKQVVSAASTEEHVMADFGDIDRMTDDAAIASAVGRGTRLTPHLRRLEAESIEILRDVAEFRNPVMLYSIGKDSGVMLHLARKAFFPAPLPFPLLHIDTTWKFREMIAFRDHMANALGFELLVHVNRKELARGIDPVASDSTLYTRVMKTEALRQALDVHGFDAALGGARRDEEKSRAKERIFSSATTTMPGTRAISVRSCGICSTLVSERASRCGCFRCRTGPSSTCGPISRPRTFRCCRFISPSRGRWCAAPAP